MKMESCSSLHFHNLKKSTTAPFGCQKRDKRKKKTKRGETEILELDSILKN